MGNNLKHMDITILETGFKCPLLLEASALEEALQVGLAEASQEEAMKVALVDASQEEALQVALALQASHEEALQVLSPLAGWRMLPRWLEQAGRGGCRPGGVLW